MVIVNVIVSYSTAFLPVVAQWFLAPGGIDRFGVPSHRLYTSPWK